MLKPSMFKHPLTWFIASLIMISVTLLPAASVLAAAMDSSQLSLLAKAGEQREIVITLANKFTVSKDQLANFLERWDEIGKYMRKQPGFVSAELQKDILNTKEWTMSEQWRSLDDYKHAVSTQEFQAILQDFPAKATWFAKDLFPSR